MQLMMVEGALQSVANTGNVRQPKNRARVPVSVNTTTIHERTTTYEAITQ